MSRLWYSNKFCPNIKKSCYCYSTISAVISHHFIWKKFAMPMWDGSSWTSKTGELRDSDFNDRSMITRTWVAFLFQKNNTGDQRCVPGGHPDRAWWTRREAIQWQQRAGDTRASQQAGGGGIPLQIREVVGTQPPSSWFFSGIIRIKKMNLLLRHRGKNGISWKYPVGFFVKKKMF